MDVTDAYADSPLMRVVKRGIAIVVIVHCTLALAAGYRAWYQIHSLDLEAPGALFAGTTVGSRVVSYARTHVDVVIEIEQDGHRERIASMLVPGNWNAGYNPLLKRASQSVVLSPEVMGRLHPGRAIVRATATGRHQWMRLPPPLVRETVVEIPCAS